MILRRVAVVVAVLVVLFFVAKLAGVNLMATLRHMHGY
jgi:hypothetical protein